MIVAAPLLLLLIAAAPQKDQARELVDRGNAHFDASRFADAIVAYESALALYPSPRILVNLAEAQRQAGFWGAALVNFQKFIDEGGAKPGSRIHLSLLARIREIQERAARLVITGADHDAEISIDAVPIRGGVDAPILLAPGRHELIARAVGRTAMAVTVMLEAGATLRLPLLLEPVLASQTRAVAVRSLDVSSEPSLTLSRPHPALSAPVSAERSVVEEWWFWTIVGAVVVGAAAGTMALSSGGGDVPASELGASRFSTWEGPR